MSQTERLYKIRHLLALGKCLGKQRLLDELGVSPATLKRDLAHLRYARLRSATLHCALLRAGTQHRKSRFNGDSNGKVNGKEQHPSAGPLSPPTCDTPIHDQVQIQNRSLPISSKHIATPTRQPSVAIFQRISTTVHNSASLLDLFAWSEAEFKQRMAGSAILRIGYPKWLSNIAIALGNALRAAPGAGLQDDAARSRIHQGLQGHANHESVVVRESVRWALARIDQPKPGQPV